jgi:hypothetical protein
MDIQTGVYDTEFGQHLETENRKKWGNESEAQRTLFGVDVKVLKNNNNWQFHSNLQQVNPYKYFLGKEMLLDFLHFIILACSCTV